MPSRAKPYFILQTTYGRAVLLANANGISIEGSQIDAAKALWPFLASGCEWSLSDGKNACQCDVRHLFATRYLL